MLSFDVQFIECLNYDRLSFSLLAIYYSSDLSVSIVEEVVDVEANI